MEGTEHRVFISHSAESEEIALRLSEYLGAKGWSSSVGRQLAASKGWLDAVAEEIEKAEAIVLVVGSEPTEAARSEWGLALRASWNEGGKKVVPVLLLGAEPPSFLRDVQAVRLADDLDQDGFEKVFQAISSATLNRSSPSAEEGQDRLSERLDQVIEALRRDSPNKEELRKHREALASSLSSAEGPPTAILCLSVGLIDSELGNFGSARSFLERALAEVDAEEEPDPQRLVTVLMPLGEAQAETEDYPAAIETYERALDLQSGRQPGSVGEAAARQELGVALVEDGRPEEAQKHLSRALEISREGLGAQHPRVAVLELWLAIAAESCGDYETAKGVYQEALANREGDPGDIYDQVTRLLGLGNALNQLRDLEGARQSLRRALDLAKDAEIPSETLVTINVALGDVEVSRGNLNDARELFENAVDLEQANGVRFRLAATKYGLGRILFELGELEEAKKVLSHALILAEEAGADRTVVNSLFVLGLVAREEGDGSQAEKRLRQAIELRRQHDPSDERQLLEMQRALDQILESSAPA
jgi:tetratricopeptide (TPR) repeat protein